MCSTPGNAKGANNSSKSNDDNEKNAKKSGDDTVEPGQGTSLGDIPRIEKYILNTRIDGLQTLYQVSRQRVKERIENESFVVVNLPL